MKIYCIDTSALIDLKNDYPPANFPSLWDKFESLVNEGRLIAPVEVRKEIEKGDDELVVWAKKNKGMFRRLDQRQLEVAAQIMHKHPKLVDPNKEQDADPFVIALGLTIIQEHSSDLFFAGCTVVSHEKRKPDKIPLVCEAYGIQCLRIIDVIKNENWKI